MKMGLQLIARGVKASLTLVWPARPKISGDEKLGLAGPTSLTLIRFLVTTNVSNNS